VPLAAWGSGHGRDGLAGKGWPPPCARTGHIRRSLFARAHAARRCDSLWGRKGLDPTWSRRRPHASGHLWRAADRAPVIVIGDAVRAGKSKEAIADAFQAISGARCRGHERSWSRRKPPTAALYSSGTSIGAKWPPVRSTASLAPGIFAASSSE